MVLMCVNSASLRAITFKLGRLSLTSRPRRFFLTQWLDLLWSFSSYQFDGFDRLHVDQAFWFRMPGPYLIEIDLANCNTSIGWSGAQYKYQQPAFLLSPRGWFGSFLPLSTYVFWSSLCSISNIRQPVYSLSKWSALMGSSILTLCGYLKPALFNLLRPCMAAALLLPAV